MAAVGLAVSWKSGRCSGQMLFEIVLGTSRKAAIIKGLSTLGCEKGRVFRVRPVMTTSILLHVSISTSVLRILGRTDGENSGNYSVFRANNYQYIVLNRRRPGNKPATFRVLHLRPLGQLSKGIYLKTSFPENGEN